MVFFLIGIFLLFVVYLLNIISIYSVCDVIIELEIDFIKNESIFRRFLLMFFYFFIYDNMGKCLYSL